MQGPLYRSDDYRELLGCRPVGIEGTREEVEAYEAKQRDPFAKLRFPYGVSGDGIIRDSSGRFVSQYEDGVRERRVITASANLLPLIGAYKKARIDNRGEQHLRADPSNPVLWHIKELFDGYDAVVELARKV